jgi:sarcosine oxidase
VTSDDEVPLRRFAERYFPEGAGRTLDLRACLFELSPDEHFLIDRHPESELAVLGAGFSGHGFKFCSVVGEILADLALDGRTLHDIGFLRLGRFG